MIEGVANFGWVPTSHWRFQLMVPHICPGFWAGVGLLFASEINRLWADVGLHFPV